MFHCALILGVAVVYIVQHCTATGVAPPPEDNPSEEEIADARFMTYAKWSTSISLSLVLICLSAIATLSRSLDKPGDLKVTNRWLRLLPRLGVVIVAMCLLIKPSMMGVTHLAVCVALLSMTLNWEWYASLEKDGGVFEP